MPDFSSLWLNPLLSATVLNSSRENKAECAIKAQSKLELNPPVGAPYPALIAASRSALDLFLSSRGGTTLNMQKAATQRLDALLPLIISTGKLLEGAVLNTFETDPAVLTEFFPNGRTELSTARRGDMEGILTRLVGRATAYQAQLGAAWVTRLTNLQNQWKTNFALQSGAISQVDEARGQVDTYWENVAWAYFDIAQQLSVDNPRKPMVAQIYFDFSMFTRRGNSDTDGLGRLVIRVADMAGVVLINARVVIRDLQGQDVAIGITDNEGLYNSPDLPIGFYDAIANQVGYVDRMEQFQVFDDNDPVREMRLATL